jgi:enolase-phosphatase E1
MMKAILLDIEGTTTPITFVHDILFPYAKTHIGKFVETHFGSLRHEIEQLVSESAEDETYTVPVDPTEPGSISTYLEHLVGEDRKSTPLKSIQGMIWQAGYESGELKSSIFEDVPRAFGRWTDAGIPIAIYSSGSVLAQRLLFRYTDHGDMTPFISKYFDTTTGGKREAASYSKIARELGLEPSEIVFCSDIPAELYAAGSAGLKTVLVVREGNAPVEDAGSYRPIQSFDEIN